MTTPSISDLSALREVAEAYLRDFTEDTRDAFHAALGGLVSDQAKTVLALLDHLASEKARADAAEANCERWRLNSIANHEAFTAMRNTINEVVPMQSAEADLLRGPEQSVACAAIASAVVATIASLTEQLAEAREALKPFAKAFERRRDAYSRRHQDRELGYANFDKMPDSWAMEAIVFNMAAFRRASSALFGDKDEREG